MTALTKKQIDDYEKALSDRMTDVDYDNNTSAADTWMSVEKTHDKEQALYNEFLDNLHQIYSDRVAFLDRLSDILEHQG